MTEPNSEILQICGLEASYGPRWDSNDAQGWAGLFTEDGVFAVARPDGTAEIRARGRTELAGRCALFNGSHQGLHFLSLPELEVEGHTAQALVTFTFRGSTRVGGGTLDVNGLYKVEYLRTDEGWRISHRLEVPTMRRTTETHIRDVDALGWLSEQE